jgi:hypothetical protein
VALFCNPASGGKFSSTAIEIIKWVTKIAVAKVCGDLRLDCLSRPRFVAGVPGLTLKVKTVKSEGVPHLEAWEYRIQKNSLSLLMVSKDSIKGYMR